MILVAGGQFDINLGALLRRMLQRRVDFCELLVGTGAPPQVIIDLRRDRMKLNGKSLRPTACFMRHDVFLSEASQEPEANAATLNWYVAIKGWELAHDDVRGFNKRLVGPESNKLRNLYLAARHGLPVPRTLLTNDFKAARAALKGPLIEKPAAGGEYTEDLGALVTALASRGPVARYPRFVQPRLSRPELRVYRIGATLLGFSLTSPDLDYRTRQRVRLKPTGVPAALGGKLVAFCDELGLDFAAADFMRDPKTGKLAFLEVNSQPMFATFDLACRGRLCDAIIDHLSAGQRPPEP